MEPPQSSAKPTYTVFLIAMVLALTAVSILWRPLATGEQFAPARLLPHIEPWKSEMPQKLEPIPWNPLLWDGIAQFYPWRDYVWRTERAGFIPLWNPHQFNGTPMLANSQSAPLYPPHLLLAWVGTATGLLLAALFHLWWAGFGTALLMRRMGAGVVAALLAGIAFQLSSFMVSWLQLPSVPATIAWCPWLLLAAHKLRERTDARNGAGLAACVGLLLLAGHLQFAFYGLFLLGLFGIGLWVMGGLRARFALGGLAAVGLGVALALPQLLPALELGRNSHRQVSPSEEAYQAYSGTAPGWQAAALYFLPDLYGHPITGSYWGYARNGRLTNYAETAMFVGIPVMALALFGLFARSRQKEQLIIAIILTLFWLLAFSFVLDRLLFFFVPGFAATGSPGRALSVCALLLALLGGFGLDRLLKAEPNRSLLLALGGAFATVIALTVLLSNAAASHGREIGIGAQLVRTTLAAGAPMYVLLFLLFAAAVALTVRPVGTLRLGPPAILFITFLGLWVQNEPYNPTAPAWAVYPVTPAIERLRAEPGVAGINRNWNLLDAPNAALPPNTGTVYGLFDITGYDSLIPKTTKARLDQLNGRDSAPPENGNMLFLRGAPNEAAGLGLRLVYSPQDAPGGSAQAAGGGLYRVSGEPSIEIERSFGRVRFEATGPSDYSLPVSYYPGWVAAGARIQPDERGLMKVTTTAAGPVELRFEPVSFRVGLYFGLAALACLVGLVVAGRQSKNS